MWRKLFLIAGGLLALAVMLLALIIVSIRSGLQRFSDDAVARFPGDRREALMRMVDCDSCNIGDRNHAVWALGQMVEDRALAVLRKGSRSLMGADRRPDLIKHSWENTFDQIRSGTRSAWISAYRH